MAYESISNVESGDVVDKDKPNKIKNNIDNLRSRLTEASNYNWNENPLNEGDIVESPDINELQDALDGAEDKNNCQDCSDRSDNTDNTDRTDDTDRTDHGDDGDRGDRGDRGDYTGYNSNQSEQVEYGSVTSNDNVETSYDYCTNNSVNEF